MKRTFAGILAGLAAAAVFAGLVYIVLVAAHVSEPASTTVQGPTPMRLWATASALLALVGVVIGGLELHRQMLERDRTQEGLDREDAARRARQLFGNSVAAHAYARDAWTFERFERLAADIRYALRAMRKASGFTCVAILSLALGIGANTAIFTLINAVMLTSLPVSRPDELVMLEQRGGRSRDSVTFSPALWQRIREEQDVFSSVAVYGATGGGDLGLSDSRRTTIGLVSGGFFSTLGVRPALGRTFNDADDRPGCPPVAVITHDFWRGALGARADVLTQSIPINNRPFEIVGVAEPEFFGIEYGMYFRCGCRNARPRCFSARERIQGVDG
jgi:hypothetical protein